MSWIKSLSILFFSILVALSILELLIRVFTNQTLYSVSQYPKEIFNHSMVTGLSPNFKGKFPVSEISGDIIINSKGIRDAEKPYIKKTDVYRILGLGDSFAFGHGVPLEDSYLSLLESRLQNKLDGDLDIVKAGVPGVGPEFYLSLLKNEGVKYDPDLVIVSFFIGNDVINSTTRINNQHLDTDLKHKNTQEAFNFYLNTKLFLRRNIYLYSFVVDRLKTIPSVRRFLQENNIASGVLGSHAVDLFKKDYNSKHLDSWENALSYLREIKHTHDNMVLVIIPSREQVDSSRFLQAINQMGYLPNDFDIYKPNKIIKKFSDNENILLIDLLPGFIDAQKKYNLFFDIDPHFNKEGNALASEIIFKHLFDLDVF